MELPELQMSEIDAFLNRTLDRNELWSSQNSKGQKSMLFLMKSCMKNLKLIFVLTLKLTLVLALEMTLVLSLASTMLCNLEMTLVLTVKLPLVLTLKIHQRIDPRIVRQGPSCLMAPRRWPVFKSTLVWALKLTFVLTLS